jgi:putative peptidoglycan lipid II flippase
VIVRGFYALGDCGTPVRVAAWMVGLNLALNLTLIWPMAEAGLAVSTSLAAAVQVFVLMAIFSRRQAPLHWRDLSATAARTILSTMVMAAIVYVALDWTSAGDRLWAQIVHVFVPIALGMAGYCAAYWLLGGRELGMLLGGR